MNGNGGKIGDDGRKESLENPITQSLSHGSLYPQSRPYLEIMRISQRQIEICIAAPFRISKMRVVQRLMIFIIVVIVNKICCKGEGPQDATQEITCARFRSSAFSVISDVYIVKLRLEDEQKPKTSKTSYLSAFAHPLTFLAIYRTESILN